MTMRMKKTTSPTRMEPPITKWPKLSITTPAYPCRRMSRVAATLRARRNMVATRTSVGNTEKSSGRFTCMAVRRIRIDPVMLAVMRRSTTNVGSGTTRTTTTATTERGMAMVTMRRQRWSWPAPDPSARGSAMHIPRLVSKDSSHVRHPLPATASHSVPGPIPAVLAWHCSVTTSRHGGKVQGDVPARHDSAGGTQRQRGHPVDLPEHLGGRRERVDEGQQPGDGRIEGGRDDVVHLARCVQSAGQRR